MNRRVRSTVVGYAVGAVAVAGVTLVYRQLLHVNPTTSALSFLLVVLAVSATWGLRQAVITSLLATLAFNYFFLPPVGTFIISDPQNWVAMFAFLATAVIASQLSERARREAENANVRRREVERLYGFSQMLLASDRVAELLNAVPRYVVESFGSRAAAIHLPNRADVYRSAAETGGLEVHDLQLVAARGEPRIESQREVAILPLRMGARVVGSMGVSGMLPSRTTLEAVASLIAVAMERAHAIETLGKAEAARESEQLRTVLLDSVTHEFRTPLTAIKASATTLLSNPALENGQRTELLTVINEESDRLNRLVGEAAEMAQLDANRVELHKRPLEIVELVEAARKETRQAEGSHPVEVRLPKGLPAVLADPDRIQEVLVHLLENAAKYSPPGAVIHITAEHRRDKVITSVADHGPGIDDFEQALIFDKFYRGHNQRLKVQGTGMGLAIAKAIVEAHGGTIGVTSQLGRGSVFFFSLPAV